MADNDVLQAFQSLADSIRSVSIGNSVKRAQEKVDEIRSSQELNEFEKIKAQQAIAKSVGGSIAALGGNAFQQQQAMASLAPEVPDAQMARLEATGEATIADATQSLIDEEEKKQLDREKRAFQRQQLLQKQKEQHEKDMFGIKAEAKDRKPLGRKELESLSKPAQQASQWLQVARGVERIGAGKLLTPEALGDEARTVLERVKAATESKARADLFGASLTDAERASFDDIRGSLLKSGLTADRYAAGFKALADLQKQVYSRTLRDFAIGKVGTQEQLLKHLASNRNIFNTKELQGLALEVRNAKEQSLEDVNAQLGLAPAATQPASQGFPVNQSAPASIPGLKRRKP